VKSEKIRLMLMNLLGKDIGFDFFIICYVVIKEIRRDDKRRREKGGVKHDMKLLPHSEEDDEITKRFFLFDLKKK
jgi:hypothetical protein